ncbi:transcription factor Adf-1-like [Xenia sp. Carnegie-2017]|uniref:transcription factor Adf-1-like n=1 Tax=Xenia sp. Carnegie-2017 TaxID=2897299 RepID=UPI001F04B546|nr:transcription factor Adf-1-like [Xenia sp. Carnegie-2017]XP_046859264.1 transcription factor Adf-1-like [Xenia sp. Carnegie-2017]XP_046859268.1 transcription factor Adf-1-like [Xenia sp. Carnegie-2017]
MVKSRGYRDKTQKENAWQCLANEIEQPVSSCQAKWKGLRDTFSENVRNQNLPSGSGTRKEIRWKWFRSMDFIRETILHRATSSNLSCNQSSEKLHEIDEEDIVTSDSNEIEQHIIGALTSTPTTEKNKRGLELSTVGKKKLKHSPIKRKTSVERKIDLEILKILKADEKNGNACGNQGNSVEDDCMAYGKYVGVTLSKFDNYHKSLAKMKIAQVLFEVESSLTNFP